MNKSTPEYIRVREEIAINLWANDDEVTFKEAEKMWKLCQEDSKRGHHGDCTKEPNSCAVCTINKFLQRADSILEIKGIGIISDNQRLPEPIFSYPLKEASRAYYDVGQDRMVQANFKRLVE